MPKGDGAFLGGMFFLSALAFVLPFLRTVKFFGIALFGWWMAAVLAMALGATYGTPSSAGILSRVKELHT